MARDDAYLAALLEEREAYARRGLTDRVKDVDAELKRVGHAPKAARAAAVDGKAVQSAPEKRA